MLYGRNVIRANVQVRKLRHIDYLLNVVKTTSVGATLSRAIWLQGQVSNNHNVLLLRKIS